MTTTNASPNVISFGHQKSGSAWGFIRNAFGLSCGYFRAALSAAVFSVGVFTFSVIGASDTVTDPVPLNTLKSLGAFALLIGGVVAISGALYHVIARTVIHNGRLLDGNEPASRKSTPVELTSMVIGLTMLYILMRVIVPTASKLKRVVADEGKCF